MPKTKSQQVAEESQALRDVTQIIENEDSADPATIQKIQHRLAGVRATCMGAARECEILLNWLAKRKS